MSAPTAPSNEPPRFLLSLNRTSFFSGVAVALLVIITSALLTVWHLRQEAENRVVASTQNLVQ